MKHFILLLSACLSIVTMAENSDSRKILPTDYFLVSDTVNAEIPSDKFVISGTVKMFSSAMEMDDVLVGCTSSGSWIRTDSMGKFRLELPATDSVVYFYKKGWSEVVIEDYDFKPQHEVVFDVYLTQQSNGGVKRKPVMYLYSDKEVTAEIQVNPYGEFIFTYPAYQDKWTASVSPEKGIAVDGKQYPYLFWEAKSPVLEVKKENGKIPGFIVRSEEIVPFFEDKLELLGFNQTEKTDFITYWGPVLQQKEYAFIQFAEDELYESEIAALNITPKPDASKRVFIYCSPLNSDQIGMEVVDQELSSFERKGFTVVEWGGGIVDLNYLKYEIGL